MRKQIGEIGSLGEDIAVKFLVKRGMAILGRNYRKPWGEIDVIAEKDAILHFVEVKTTTTRNGSRETLQPEDNLHEAKIRRLERVIQTYLWEHRIGKGRVWSLDALLIQLDIPTKKAWVKFIEGLTV